MALLALVGLFVAAAVVLSTWKTRADRARLEQEVAALAALLRRFEDVFEKSPVGYIETDREGVVRRVNGAECAFRGLSREEILGKKLWDLDGPEEENKTRDRFVDALKSEETVISRKRYTRRDSSEIIVDMHYSQLVEDRQVMGVMAASLDTSDRAQAEEQALQTTGELRAIFNAFPDAFLRLDPAGVILDYRASAASLFDLPKEPIGKRLQDLLPKPADTVVARAVADVQRTRATTTAEFCVSAAEAQRWYEVRLAPVNWNETLALVRNITDKKLAEEKAEQFALDIQTKNRELADALVTAREATRLKNRFLANMSHEIRTPINGVMGMLELLLETHLDEEQRDYAEAAKQSSDRLLKVVGDVLDISTIEAGKLTFDTVGFDLRTLLEQLTHGFAPLAAAKGLAFDARIHTNVPRVVRGEPARLRQVLSNLLDNAVKFTERGRIAFRVEPAASTDETHTLRFAVEDTGPGISPQQRPHLFQSFMQGDSSTTRRHGGTGLGLAISKHLVQMMGGEIGVDSQPGQGTTVSFTALFERPGSGGVPEGEAPEGLQNVRILVAEADTATRELLRQHLSFWGCRYLEVTSGRRVVEELRQAAVDGQGFRLALVALDLPDEDGVSVAHSIKSDPVIRNTILVSLVPSTMRGDGAALRAIGFSGFVPKPVRPGDLFETLLEEIRAQDQELNPVSPARRPGEPFKLGLRKTPARVLLAEDDAINQKMVLRLLEKAGVEVDAVFDGRRAVEAFAQRKYDVVLMDVQMPKMDGLEAATQIRAKEGKSGHTPILALTANAMPGDRERCLAAGMDDYLSKPVSLDALQEAILRWLPRERAEEPSKVE